MWGPVFEGIADDGSFIFQDIDGDGVIEAGFGEDDNTVIGNGLPDFEFGWNNSFTFGNFDFNFFLRGAVGHDLINSFRIFYETLDPAGIGTWNRVQTDYFDPSLTAPNTFSSYQVEDASFLRLDNATLGYTFDLAPGSAFTAARLYLSGQNLFVISNYSGVDPEVSLCDPGETDNGNSTFNAGAFCDPLAPGLDRRNTYFLARAFSIGINLGL